MSGLSEVVIKIDGKNICEDNVLDYIETCSCINSLPYAIIRIHDFFFTSSESENLCANNPVFKIGAKVEIEFGDQEEIKSVFEGVLLDKAFKMDAQEGFCFLELHVYTFAYKMHIVKKNAFYSDKTDSDIIKDIISKYDGIKPKLGNMALKHESIIQRDITDWDFINMRSQVYGFVVCVSGDSITVDSPQNVSSGVKTIFGENILEMNLKINSSHQIEKACGKIWDKKNQKIKDISSESVKDNFFDKIKASDITKNTDKQEFSFLHDGVGEEEMKALVNGIMSLNRLAKVIGTITIEGNADVKCNSTIDIERCAENFNGKAYVSGVKHIFENGDWVTKIFIGFSPLKNKDLWHNVKLLHHISGIKYGKVVKIDGDKESEFRIFVNIPLFHNEGEGIWCRLATFYASSCSGAFFFPEVDDEVIVSFVDSDPREAIVLGVLYNAKNKPKIEKIDAKNEIKGIYTKGGLEISFDEKDKIVKIKTATNREIIISDKDESIILGNNGDTFSLTKDGVKIKSSKDIIVEGKNINFNANGSVNIKAKSDVKIEATNISTNGSMGVEVKGGNGAKLESSGITEIKGSMVNIN